ncbi:MAG: hypothetical protein FGM37_11000, partial [Phycisphaerales bacterium]|nr:hypothetical protein [Phycisphaerales bacterium]
MRLAPLRKFSALRSVMLMAACAVALSISLMAPADAVLTTDPGAGAVAQSASPAAKPQGSPKAPSAAPSKSTQPKSSQGKKATPKASPDAKDKAPSAAEPAEKLKSVYVVPFKGQFGTDIHPACYDEILKDLEERRPDIIIFELDSADVDRVEYMGEDPRNAGVFSAASDDTMMRKLLRDFKDKHSYAQQYMWVKDSVGYG